MNAPNGVVINRVSRQKKLILIDIGIYIFFIKERMLANGTRGTDETASGERERERARQWIVEAFNDAN